MPFTDDMDVIDQRSFRLNEVAKLGYYSVTLTKHQVKVEITTTHKVSFFRFTYQPGSKKDLKIDPGFLLGEHQVTAYPEAQQLVGSEIEVVSETEVKGYSRVRGGWNNGAAYTIYFYAEFDRPLNSFTTWKNDKLFPNISNQADYGEKTGALLYFGITGSNTINVKIGISYISTLRAKQNIAKEIPDWNFEQTLSQNRETWETMLNRIDIDPKSTVDQKVMFYTALYHTMLMPVDRTGENPLWTTDQPYYDDFSAIWDTFRSSSPLIMLIAPSRQTAIANALLNIYQHDGYLPDARSGNYNGRTQGGSHAEVVLADAYVKGLPGIDYKLALEAMLKDANVPPGGNEEKEGRGGLSDYNSLGYLSSNFARAGNRTVDYAYDDYCIAELAKGLNRMPEYKRFIKQADNWQNLWRSSYKHHGAQGFILPKDAAGHWLDSIPYSVTGNKVNYFTYTPLTHEYPKYACWWCCFMYEGTSWEYSLSIPHDIPEVIKRSGGNAAFIARLDTLFKNNYYHVGNEPSFLTPCLYHWAGRPDLSGQQVRQIISKNYNSSARGIPGNDDSGAMSSWLAFHLMGFYPNAGQPYYLLHAPLLTGATIHQENGRDFKIIAKNLSSKNTYVKSVTLNGKPFKQAWIEHKDIVNGGELIFEMDAQPSDWGTRLLPPLKL
ncbi:MAG TPA: GH92 family glycosyl hydrolase [Mucilaginibacter sp.]|jgi:predicted alpha-1,2-mannosidase|nr:GH92 family glycosyl hydrolase [Mucilaginibacter sp.]